MDFQLMTLVFDTETTGKADLRLPFDHPAQPRIVQIGAQLFDDGWRIRGELNLILKPEGFTIPASASAIHGITQEIAERYGVHRCGALMMLSELANRAQTIVAHNLDFDRHMVDVETVRHIVEFPAGHEVEFCTMREMTPICKIPSRNGYSDYKWPRLDEAYRFAFNEDFDGAHDAMADVRACARIYRWLQERKPAYA